VNQCFAGRARYFYKMFWMNPDVFMSLHDLLVSNYGLKSTRNVSSVEALPMFLWIVGCPQSFSQAEDRFQRSLWTIHTKFKEVLLCLRKLGKYNIKPRDPTFSIDHAKVQEVLTLFQRCYWCYRWVTCSSSSSYRGGCESHMSTWVHFSKCASSM
jgi:hypothetical protein